MYLDYLTNQPNVSSDKRIKQFIQDIPESLLNKLMDVKPKMYQQDDGKWHFGYIAQDVERIIYKETMSMYGWEQAKNIQEKFAIVEKGESHLSLLYGELSVLKDAYHDKQINDLEERMSRLEKLIKEK